MKKLPRLNRFTSLPVLLDMLSKRCVTLLNPRSWEDRNDSFYIEQYRAKKKLESVLALCFTTTPEKFHHWKIFSDGSSGVRVEFDKNLLLKAFSKIAGLRCGYVHYKLIKQLKSDMPNVMDWPFLKRKPFSDEVEYRIIFQSKTEARETMEIPFDLPFIRRITLSPWLAKPVSESVKHVIKSIDGCQQLKVSRSTLIENSAWRAAIMMRSCALLPESPRQLEAGW